eukprot:5505770-Pyramimonas_sp.AAC.1
MAAGRPVPGEVLGLGQKRVYLATAVLPMGWVLSVLIFHHVHRRLGLLPAPHGALLPGDREWRRDRPVPMPAVLAGPAAGSREWWQACVDDFDGVE